MNTPEAGADVALHRFASAQSWRSGDADGVAVLAVDRGGVVISAPTGKRDYADPHTGITRTYETATWTSPLVSLDFGATEIVPSWNATTPPGTWVEIAVEVTYSDGEISPWFVLGRWTSGGDDADIRRTTVDHQRDDRCAVDSDVLAVSDPAAGLLVEAYRLRVTLHRPSGSPLTPRVWLLTALASTIPDRFEAPPSQGRLAWGTELAVPRLSQRLHRGRYPQYGGGGQVWCSPTSTTMVLAFHGYTPSAAELAWVEPGYVDPQVAHAARSTWDHAYGGAGNWAFNTAYAASFIGVDAFVTRLRSMDDLERFIAAGLPVITSQSFLEAELDGADYGTAGHLMTVVGFTDEGDVIANDPASDTNDAVRHVYRREQFARHWLRTKRITSDGDVGGGSGGIVYVIVPAGVPLPAGGNGAW